MHTTALFPRKRILNALGFLQNASRSSWSHDDGKRIFFDAWVNRYAENGAYPMCTTKAYPRPDESGLVTVGGVTEPTKRGHTMWLAHLDLVLAGQREAILINPVPREPGQRQGDKGAKGWLPRYSTGVIVRDGDGIWFQPEKVTTLDLERVVKWSSSSRQKIEDRRTTRVLGSEDATGAAKALLERHLSETAELLEMLG